MFLNSELRMHFFAYGPDAEVPGVGVVIDEDWKGGDDGLSHLRQIRSLKRLDIGVGPGTVSNEGLRHIRGLRKLTHLDLSQGAVTDAGLGQLRDLPSLETLKSSSNPDY